MKTRAYEVVITEVYKTTVLVEGTSKADAVKQVREGYQRGNIEPEHNIHKVNFETSRDFEIPDVCPICGKEHNPEERDFFGTEGRCNDCYLSLFYDDL